MSPGEEVMRSTPLILLAAATVVACTNSAYAQKNPPRVNPTHYQCYRVKPLDPQFKPRVVELRDQFGKSRAKVLRPLFLCAPTDKNKLRARDRITHYLCYEDEGPKVPQRDVRTINQFGTENMEVANPALLCVPSLKRVIK
jgi:hypothetical protein